MKELSKNLPSKIDNLTREQCAIILQKALAASTQFSSIAQLARAAGLNRRTINSYFLASKKPRIENWNKLRDVLIEKPVKVENNEHAEEREDLGKAIQIAEKIRALKYLMVEELEFFRDAGPEERQVLKSIIPGVEAGYLSGLLAALYDEDQLSAWITFSEKQKGVHNGKS